MEEAARIRFMREVGNEDTEKCIEILTPLGLEAQLQLLHSA